MKTPDAVIKMPTNNTIRAPILSIAIPTRTAPIPPTSFLNEKASAGVIEEITPANVRTMINVADGANAYVHPNHSGEVTSTADGATVIADNIVDEANLKVSNAPSNGYMLTAQSGDTGGLTWAAAGGGTNTASYNGIINGDFSTWQRGTAFRAGNNDDDTCTASRWVLLSDGNDIVDVVRSPGDVDSSFYSIGLDVETVDKKFGIVQIIENINTGALGGKGTTPVSLSFKAKVAGGGK